jgi:hypothetical protein
MSIGRRILAGATMAVFFSIAGLGCAFEASAPPDTGTGDGDGAKVAVVDSPAEGVTSEVAGGGGTTGSVASDGSGSGLRPSSTGTEVPEQRPLQPLRRDYDPGPVPWRGPPDH